MSDLLTATTPELIMAYHPLRTKRHDLFGIAMELVGERHEKGELVELVNCLLARAELGDILLRHIDRLNDITEDDSCEQILASLLEQANST